MKVKHRTLLEVLGGIALIAICFGLVIGQTANATGNQDHTCQGGHNCNNEDGGNAEANANAEAWAEANASADANATGGNADASATGGNNALTFNAAARPDDIKIRNTASANMPNLTATSPCVVSKSGGLGAAGINIGGGKTSIDPECNIRETARTFAGLGEIGLALTIACTSDTAKAALGDRCGLTNDNVYVRVNEPVRYVERLTSGPTATHDVSEEAVETCTESTNRAFKTCVSK